MMVAEQKLRYFRMLGVIDEIYNYSKKDFFMPFFDEINLEGFKNYNIFLSLVVFDGEWTGKEIEYIFSIPGIKSTPIKVPEFIEKNKKEVIIGKYELGRWEPFFENLQIFFEYLLYNSVSPEYFLEKNDEIEIVCKKIIDKFNIDHRNLYEILSNKEKEIKKFVEKHGIHFQVSNISLFLFSLKKVPDDKEKYGIELDVSSFYKINELYANILVGGVWESLISAIWKKHKIEFNYEMGFGLNEGMKWQEYIYSREIELYAVARLTSNSGILEEKIVSLKPPFQNLINHNLRGFHDGKYCPLDKVTEINSIELLKIQKKELIKLNNKVDSLPLLEQRKEFINRINSEVDNNELKVFLEKIFRELIEHNKKTEAGSIQSMNSFNDVFRSKRKPPFYSYLSNSFQKYFDTIERNIKALSIYEEDTITNKVIISDFGEFLGKVLTSFFRNFIQGEEIKISYFPYSIQDKLSKETFMYWKEYTKKWKDIYNDVRHEDKDIDLSNTISFVNESSKLLQNILKDKMSD